MAHTNIYGICENLCKVPVSPKENANFINSISMGRNPNSTVGENSVALGDRVIASGDCSYAQGLGTTASGDYSHAEGSYTIASGYNSHAQGLGTTASGDYSHAEGQNTEARGECSHAEGYHSETEDEAFCSHANGEGTVACSNHQTVIGRYNIRDYEGKYAFIIGNGTDEQRSNALAIKWDGTIVTHNF